MDRKSRRPPRSLFQNRCSNLQPPPSSVTAVKTHLFPEKREDKRSRNRRLTLQDHTGDTRLRKGSQGIGRHIRPSLTKCKAGSRAAASQQAKLIQIGIAKTFRENERNLWGWTYLLIVVERRRWQLDECAGQSIVRVVLAVWLAESHGCGTRHCSGPDWL